MTTRPSKKRRLRAETRGQAALMEALCDLYNVKSVFALPVAVQDLIADNLVRIDKEEVERGE